MIALLLVSLGLGLFGATVLSIAVVHYYVPGVMSAVIWTDGLGFCKGADEEKACLDAFWDTKIKLLVELVGAALLIVLGLTWSRIMGNGSFDTWHLRDCYGGRCECLCHCHRAKETRT